MIHFHVWNCMSFVEILHCKCIWLTLCKQGKLVDKLKDFNIICPAMWDHRHKGATRKSQSTRHVASSALTYPTIPWILPISNHKITRRCFLYPITKGWPMVACPLRTMTIVYWMLSSIIGYEIINTRKACHWWNAFKIAFNIYTRVKHHIHV